MKKQWLLGALIAGSFLPAIMWGLLSSRQDGEPTRLGEPQRVISLCLPATEILCRLGAQDTLVAISEGDCPEAVKDLPRVGKAFGNVDVEAIVAFEPDIVFCWRGAGEVLSRRGIRTYVVETRDLDGVISLVEEIGQLVNRPLAAARLAGEMRRRIRHIEAKVATANSRPLVYFESGSLGKSRGPGTLTHDLIVRAGGENIAGKEPVPYPLLSAEYIIARDPDVIIIEEYGASPDEVVTRDGWTDLEAVRQGRVHCSPTYCTNYTPRCVEGLEQFARWIHPEVFEQ